MLRPRWVLALLLALAVAAGFALLGQWQLERAIESGQVEERTTEVVQPLRETAQPDEPIRQVATGQRVSVEGRWVPGDEQIVAGRLNGGEPGYWVVSHLAVAERGEPGLAVARGWVADEAAAQAVVERLARSTDAASLTVDGRLLPSEAPEVPAEGADPNEMTTVAVAALINLWADFDEHSVYSAYLVASDPPNGLVAIDSPAPESQVTLNWLNVFYAAEWVIFAGFAVFLWYRLVKDAWEREQEELADGPGGFGAGQPGGTHDRQFG
ncbi:SURF1 family protein [Luethyella okanaganae]|uniref:SURF1-like protein n=1 Tax=Luethyella okanaganae TaxID=69372 RepID=A0ABW1VG77_9MICO